MSNKLIHQSHIKTAPVPPITVSLDFLRAISDILVKANGDALKLELDEVNKDNFSSTEEYNKYIQQIKDSFLIIARISETNGIFSIYRSDSNIFETIKKLPNGVEKITIDNLDSYQFAFNRSPKNYFKIEFDFTKVSILDFSSSPSLKTNNNSYLSISGENGNWAAGLFDNTKKLFEETDKRPIIFHKSNVYDIALWFMVIPIIIFCINKLDTNILNNMNNLSGFIKFSLHCYIFIFSLWAFRIFFNYLRWLYPYLELENSKDKSKKQRIFIWILISGFILNVIYKIAAKLIFHI